MTTTETRIAMTDLAQIRAFLMGGQALFAVENTATGNHYTYSVSFTNSQRLGWVKVLTGDNGGYQYIGLIGRDELFHWTAASKFGGNAPSVQVMLLLVNKWINKGFPPTVRFLHHGLCGVCGRPLTHPESIESGIGPIC